MEVYGYKNQECRRNQLFDQAEYFHDDTTTWLAEVLDGSMRSEFDYAFDGQELTSQDGRELCTVFSDAIDEAEVLADKNPNLVFELERRHEEANEYQEMIAMAKGEGPNTMVVVSDFPAELLASPKDVGGYNVKRKQTMLRVITREDSGMIKVRTQSLDGSDRAGLERIYECLGEEPRPGSLLGQRRRVDCQTNHEKKNLINTLTTAYDLALQEKNGGQWLAGRPQSHDTSTTNTYDFVCGQKDLIAKIENPEDGSGIEDFLYSMAAVMKARWEMKLNQRTESSYHGNVYPLNPEAEILLAVQEASARGEIFSGCGMSIGGEITGEAELRNLGYGNKTSSESKYEFNKQMYCVVCQAPPEEEAPKKQCGPCGICRECDARL